MQPEIQVSNWVRVVTTACLTVVIASGCASQEAKVSQSLEQRANLPDQRNDFQRRFYAGANFGATDLRPDLDTVLFTLQNGNAAASELKVGFDVHDRVSLEAGTSVLGTAELEATAEVEYTSLSASALVYALAGKRDRSRRQKWSAFARLGYGSSSIASNVVPLDDKTINGPLFGLGVEYGFRNGLGLRLEASRFNEEATFASIGAVYRFGDIKRLIPANVFSSAKVGATVTSDQLASNYKPPRAYLTKTVLASTVDMDGDGIANDRDDCPGTTSNTSVGSSGCGLFDGVLESVQFGNGTSRLDDTSKEMLNRLAIRLQAFPEVRVEVQAHTDATGPSEINMSLSAQRAEVVADYLAARGVHHSQLVARGYGETRPRTTAALTSTSEATDEVTDAMNGTEEAGVPVDVVIDADGNLAASDNVDADNLLAPGLSDRRVELLTLPNIEFQTNSDSVGKSEELLAELRAVERARKRAAAKKRERVAAAISTDPELPKVVTDSDEPSLGAAMAGPEESDTFVVPASHDPEHELNGLVRGVSFAAGKSDVAEDSLASLAEIAQQMEAEPQLRIAVMAHTDDQGPADGNLKLSIQRAEAVTEYLAEQGVDSARLEAEGYGEELPVVQNLTNEDRARNRRIELRVLEPLEL